MQAEPASISVLHVDDDPDFADLTADVLEQNHDQFHVKSERSVNAGLDRLGKETFDCIVSDHDMPGRDGIDFLETVRDQYGEIPFILFTGKGSEEIASEAISVGVTDYLQKEGGMDQYGILANRIRNNVERARAEREREFMRERMELALDHTGSIIFEIDLDTGTVMRHGQLEEFFDFNPDDAPTWREHLDTAVHPEDREKFRRFYEQLTEGSRHSGTLEYRMNTEGDSVRWIRDNVAIDGETNRALGFAQDITEHKNQEREREQIIARVTDAIVEVDANWRFTLVNEQAEALYDMSEAELLQEDFWDIFADARGTRFEEEYRQAMETREKSAFVEYFGRLDGWFDVRVFPNDDGGLSFYFREVSTRLDNAPGFEERQLIDQALGTLNDLLYVVAPDGDFCWWNERVPSVTGYSDEELVSMRALDVFPDDEKECITAAIEETITTGSAVVEADLLTADGTRIAYEFTGDRVTDVDGDLVGLVGSGREITERRKREHRLEALNETSQKLMAADTKDRVVEIGVASACDILGLDANGICLHDEDHGELISAAQTDAARELFGDPPPLGKDSIAWRVFERGEPLAIDDVHDEPDIYDPSTSIRSELFLPIEDYGILIASSVDTAAFGEQDVVLGTILADTIAAALTQIEYTEQLSSRKRELRRQNERLEEFTAVVSHDLRNPMEVINGRLELAKDDCDSEHLDGALQAVDRMETLIEDLLTLANEGEQIGDREVVDLEALVERCWRSVDTADATLVTDIERPIEADRSRLQQLLDNLIRNAIDHGGSNVTVTVGAFEDGFFVEDTGPGIAEENSSTVFTSGYSTSEDGTGFGLSIVKQVVDAHGWRIQLAESASGGARFEITDISYSA